MIFGKKRKALVTRKDFTREMERVAEAILEAEDGIAVLKKSLDQALCAEESTSKIRDSLKSLEQKREDLARTASILEEGYQEAEMSFLEQEIEELDLELKGSVDRLEPLREEYEGAKERFERIEKEFLNAGERHRIKADRIWEQKNDKECRIKELLPKEGGQWIHPQTTFRRTKKKPVNCLS